MVIHVMMTHVSVTCAWSLHSVRGAVGSQKPAALPGEHACQSLLQGRTADRDLMGMHVDSR